MVAAQVIQLRRAVESLLPLDRSDRSYLGPAERPEAPRVPRHFHGRAPDTLLAPRGSGIPVGFLERGIEPP